MLKTLLPILVIALSFQGCSIFKTLENLSRLQYKLGEISNVTIGDVRVDDKRTFSDFSQTDILKISASFLTGSLPINFTIHVEAKNPNDGTGGHPRTDATIKAFPFRVLLNEKQIFTGDIQNPVTVPGTGELTVIPIEIGTDLVEIFKNKSYKDLIDLALTLSGRGSEGTTSNVSLFAKPIVSTFIGDISPNEEIEIISKEFKK